MNNLQFQKLAIEYNSIAEMKKGLDKQQEAIKAQMRELMGDISSYSYGGAKATVIKSERTMFIKEKLLKKFGEKALKSCTKTLNIESVRVTFKEEE
jgi:hypothetical protein